MLTAGGAIRMGEERIRVNAVPTLQRDAANNLPKDRSGTISVTRGVLGTTPLAHYRALRLRHARSLLAQTDLSVREIGLACGFASLEHFSRSYRRLFGRPPRADRGLSMLPVDW